MTARLLCALLVGACSIPVFGQGAYYTVTSLADLPDDNLADGIFSPETLRSAIQNLNRVSGGGTIEIHGAINDGTIVLNSPLPGVFNPCHFKAKGVKINGNNVPAGLVFTQQATPSTVEDLFLFGFDGFALAVQCNNSTFASIEAYDNNGPGIVLNDADNNVFKVVPGKASYAGLVLYGNKGSSGYGMQIDEESEGNRIETGYFGLNAALADRGNDRAGLLINGPGTVVKNCVFAFNATNGIEFDMRSAAGADVIIDSCYFQVDLFQTELGIPDSVDDGDQDQGIYGLRAYNVRITNCVFGSHRSDAIDLAGVTVEDCTISNCSVGILTAGGSTTTVPTGGTGIRVGGDRIEVRNNRIAGSNTGISAQGSNIDVHSNQIGFVLANGMVSAPRSSGVALGEGTDLVIGDATDSSRRNVIIGCGRSGVVMNSTAPIQDMVIANNLIGQHPNGQIIPCAIAGIEVTGDNRNGLIKDNRIYADRLGIAIQKRIVVRQDGPVWFVPDGTTISSNQIGASPLPPDSVYQDSAGILIDYATNATVDQNSIHNSAIGIVVRSDSTRNIVITRNVIGASVVGDTMHVNSGNAIELSQGARYVTIGDMTDPTKGNLILGNGGAAVLLLDSARFSPIIYNRMDHNGGGSIVLQDGMRYATDGHHDDEDDLDEGANGFQNAPQLTSFSLVSGTLNYTGRVVGPAGSRLRIDTYVSSAYPDTRAYLKPALLHIEDFDVEVPSTGIAEFERSVTDPTIAALLGLEGAEPAMTATNQDLETSQMGTGSQSGISDLAAEFDSNSTYLGGGFIRASFIVLNEFPVPLTTIIAVDTVPSSFVVDSVHTTHGIVSVEDSLVIVEIDRLEASDTANVVVHGHATVSGIHRSRLGATSAEVDADTLNNADTLEIDVVLTSVAETVHSDIRTSSKVRISSHGSGFDVRSALDMQSLTIYDLRGTLIRHYTPHVTAVQIGDLAVGSYVVRIALSDGSSASGLVVVHH